MIGATVLRLRYPKALPIKRIEVDGKPWTDFDKDKEFIRLHGLTGTVVVLASWPRRRSLAVQTSIV